MGGLPDLKEIDAALREDAFDASALVNLWEARTAERWHEDRARLWLFLRRAFDLGEYLLVCDAAGEVLGRDGKDFDLRLLRAKALRHVGSRGEALEIVHGLALTPRLNAERSVRL